MIKNLQLVFIGIKQLILLTFLLDTFEYYNPVICKEHSSVEIDFESISNINYNTIHHNKPILIKLGQNLVKESSDERDKESITLTSSFKDALLPKAGSSYSEETRSRGQDTSETTSTLIFRQKTRSSQGKKEESKGASSAIHPENIQNFKNAGIPINPMRDLTRKPDDYNKWSWDKKNQIWRLIGEPKMKLSNGKIINQSQWNDMIRSNSHKI